MNAIGSLDNSNLIPKTDEFPYYPEMRKILELIKENETEDGCVLTFDKLIDRLHVKEVHSETISSYKHQFGGDSCTTPMNVIECHGCFKLIRHDTMHIRRHAKRSHGMTSKQ